MFNKKVAFTLSEVMITIVILGVLAALLIPVIMKTIPDNNKVMFKKAYSILEQSVNDMISDEEAYPESKTGVTTDTTTVVPLGFAYTTTTGTVVPSNVKKFCYLLSQEVNTKSVDCSTSVGSFVTADGIYWRIYDNGFPLNSSSDYSTSYPTRVVIDVNGDTEGPGRTSNGNCGDTTNTKYIGAACATGKTSDIYEIGVRYDGKLQVLSADGITILQNPSTNTK